MRGIARAHARGLPRWRCAVCRRRKQPARNGDEMRSASAAPFVGRDHALCWCPAQTASNSRSSTPGRTARPVRCFWSSAGSSLPSDGVHTAWAQGLRALREQYVADRGGRPGGPWGRKLGDQVVGTRDGHACSHLGLCGLVHRHSRSSGHVHWLNLLVQLSSQKRAELEAERAAAAERGASLERVLDEVEEERE